MSAAAYQQAEAAVRAAVERAQGRCPADAKEWHAWAKGWLAGDRDGKAHGAAASAATAYRSARQRGDAFGAAGCSDAISAAEAAIALAAATKFLLEAERCAGQVAP